MLSTLSWAGKAANANSLADPNATFDPTLPCASGEEAARDALVYADVPKSLEERLEKKPQEIGPNCLFENAESILHVSHSRLSNMKDLKLVILFGEVSSNLAFNCETIVSPSVNQLIYKQSLKKELWQTIKNKLNI